MGILRPKNPLGAQPLEDWMVRGYLEGSFELCFVFTIPNLVARSSPSYKEGNGIDQERFASSCLPG